MTGHIFNGGLVVRDDQIYVRTTNIKCGGRPAYN